MKVHIIEDGNRRHFLLFHAFLMMLLRDIVQRTLSTKNSVLECDV